MAHRDCSSVSVRDSSRRSSCCELSSSNLAFISKPSQHSALLAYRMQV